ncbi:helix-turn-helix transcriptional regulator [Cytobacillus praedii]|uniref:helix-turn-helix transcriptional regulator n=1 Tax=Cytobacillus praedii TaxID=1742358 RepID=UPI002E231CCB|nr:helix-turn-helix transcriptional regulator [Cytobacillus praedii]
MNNFNLEFIEQRRNELDIPMQTMAIELGFKNASTYLKYERGDYSFKAKQLPLLARILNCKITDFFSLIVADLATEVS